MKRIIFILIILVFAFSSSSQTKIKMKKEWGIYTIPCKVNGLELRFVFDTGASNVSISLSEAKFMQKNGYLRSNDILGKSKFSVADGSIVENTKIILREIEIGGIKLYNIEAVVVHNLDAPLLLGQSAIQRLGKIELNGNELIISNGKPISENETNTYSDEWIEVDRTNDIKKEVYTNSIKRDEYFVIYWIKSTFLTDKRKKEAIDFHVKSDTKYSNRRLIDIKNNQNIEYELYKKWNNLDYIMKKCIIDCDNNRYALMSIIFYDNKGKIIGSYDFDDINWENIAPESSIESEYKFVCEGN